jgi:hypothetical protein
VPIVFTADHARRRIDVRLTGVVGYEEMLDFVERRAAAGAATYDQIFNALGGRWRLSRTEIDALMAETARLRGGAPAGFNAIVSDHDATYGTGRVIEALTSTRYPNSRAFRTLEEAETWLRSERSSHPGARGLDEGLRGG